MSALIRDVEPGSLADRHGIKPGCVLLKINGHEIQDVLDYRFYMTDITLRVSYKTPEGTFVVLKIVKSDAYEDLGLGFETYLMDAQKRCKNNCIFCFIDQLPDGMRESLYFKDDDSRLSFFYGNYITLTNLTQADVDRIIEMHISPVNVSVHTMNPQLRCAMMKNKWAGDSLKYLKQFADAGISLNTQLVLCPGINDGDALEYSLIQLSNLGPSVQSIACVPVGLTDHRDGLYELNVYTKESAGKTIDIIDSYGIKFKEKLGTRLCYAADEFYLKAELPIPDEDYYEGYPQLENGVGMWRLFASEVDDALNDGDLFSKTAPELGKDVVLSVATGVAAYPLIQDAASKVESLYRGKNRGTNSASNRTLKINVYQIENTFFGRNITVSGLITGKDLVRELSGKNLGEALLISESMLRTTYPQDDSNDNVFLDDMTVQELEKILKVKIKIVKNDGYEFVKSIAEVEACRDL